MCLDRYVPRLRMPKSNDIVASATVVRAWRAESGIMQGSIVGGESIEHVRYGSCSTNRDIRGHLSV